MFNEFIDAKISRKQSGAEKRAEAYVLKAIKFLYENHNLPFDRTQKDLLSNLDFCGAQTETIKEAMKIVYDQLSIIEAEVYQDRTEEGEQNPIKDEIETIVRTANYELRADELMTEFKLCILELKHETIMSQIDSYHAELESIQERRMVLSGGEMLEEEFNHVNVQTLGEESSYIDDVDEVPIEGDDYNKEVTSEWINFFMGLNYDNVESEVSDDQTMKEEVTMLKKHCMDAEIDWEGRIEEYDRKGDEIMSEWINFIIGLNHDNVESNMRNEQTINEEIIKLTSTEDQISEEQSSPIDEKDWKGRIEGYDRKADELMAGWINFIIGLDNENNVESDVCNDHLNEEKLNVDPMLNKIPSNIEKIIQLDEKLNSINRHIYILDEKLSQSDIEILNIQLDEEHNIEKIAQLDEKLNSLNKQIYILDEKLSLFNKEIALDKQSNDIEKIIKLDEKLNSIVRQIYILDEKLNPSDKDIEILNMQLDEELSNNIGKMIDEISRPINMELGMLNCKLIPINKEIATLDEKSNTIEGKMKKWEENACCMTEDVTKADEKLSNIDEVIAMPDAHLTSINGRMETLGKKSNSMLVPIKIHTFSNIKLSNYDCVFFGRDNATTSIQPVMWKLAHLQPPDKFTRIHYRAVKWKCKQRQPCYNALESSMSSKVNIAAW